MKSDVLVIGAGPTGLACAIEAQKIGLKVIVLDKGCLVNSLFHYPANMVFFTTPAGGAVFSVGSINWLGALGWNAYDNNVSHVTENVLRRFTDPSPFPA